MSEITRGVIGMPLHLAMSSKLSRIQFHACAQELYAEHQRLTKQVVALQAATDSWQSGYDEGRKMGTKTALSEREQLKAKVEELEGRKKLCPCGFEECLLHMWPPYVSPEVVRLRAENYALRAQLAENELQARADAVFEEYCQEQGN